MPRLCELALGVLGGCRHGSSGCEGDLGGCVHGSRGLEGLGPRKFGDQAGPTCSVRLRVSCCSGGSESKAPRKQGPGSRAASSRPPRAVPASRMSCTSCCRPCAAQERRACGCGRRLLHARLHTWSRASGRVWGCGKGQHPEVRRCCAGASVDLAWGLGHWRLVMVRRVLTHSLGWPAPAASRQLLRLLGAALRGVAWRAAGHRARGRNRVARVAHAHGAARRAVQRGRRAVQLRAVQPRRARLPGPGRRDGRAGRHAGRRLVVRCATLRCAGRVGWCGAGWAAAGGCNAGVRTSVGCACVVHGGPWRAALRCALLRQSQTGWAAMMS